jgi:hypothetical protein
VTYSTAEGRQELLDELAAAIAAIGVAIALLTEAYELLDEQSGDLLEEQLFRPAQAAYGVAKRTHSSFASRYGLPSREFNADVDIRPTTAGDLVERAVDELINADDTIASLQDSLLPVEVGDPEVRAGLSQVRETIAPLPARSQNLTRTLGR